MSIKEIFFSIFVVFVLCVRFGVDIERGSHSPDHDESRVLAALTLLWAGKRFFRVQKIEEKMTESGKRRMRPVERVAFSLRCWQSDAKTLFEMFAMLSRMLAGDSFVRDEL